LITTKITITILCFIFAQTIAAQKLDIKNVKEYWKTEKKTPILVSAISKESFTIQNKVAPNYYTTQTGFFCNQERAFEKKTKIPFKFRLGSLSYTEQLEGY
jgi:hypothetical protein